MCTENKQTINDKTNDISNKRYFLTHCKSRFATPQGQQRLTGYKTARKGCALTGRAQGTGQCRSGVVCRPPSRHRHRHQRSRSKTRKEKQRSAAKNCNAARTMHGVVCHPPPSPPSTLCTLCSPWHNKHTGNTRVQHWWL